MVADGGEEFDGCKCAVGDQDNIAVGKPAADLQGGLTSPIKQRLGRLRFAEIEAFRGGEQREEWQRHDAAGPRHLHQQHGRKPAQAAGFDEVPLGRADWVAKNGRGASILAPQRCSMVSSSPITTRAWTSRGPRSAGSAGGPPRPGTTTLPG